VTRGHIVRDDADSAARNALAVGRLITEAHVKGAWESHALRGRRNAASLNAAAARRNRKRQNAAAQRYELWRAMANRVWAQNKHLTATDVAKRIAGEVGGNPDTIRRKIIHNR
jgi:hypothetical protein